MLELDHPPPPSPTPPPPSLWDAPPLAHPPALPWLSPSSCSCRPLPRPAFLPPFPFPPLLPSWTMHCCLTDYEGCWVANSLDEIGSAHWDAVCWANMLYGPIRLCLLPRSARLLPTPHITRAQRSSATNTLFLQQLSFPQGISLCKYSPVTSVAHHHLNPTKRTLSPPPGGGGGGGRRGGVSGMPQVLWGEVGCIMRCWGF